MSDDTPAPVPTPDPASTPEPVVTEARILEAVQNENRQLKARLEELSAAHEQAQAQAGRLEEAEQANQQLRRRLANTALSAALAEAAGNVALPPQAVAIYAHRFLCRLDDEGNATVEPNPTEFLLQELRANPLLQRSAEQIRLQRQARQVAQGLAPVAAADSAELMAALDKDPARKAQFIQRHGSGAFIELAAKARREGYRT